MMSHRAWAVVMYGDFSLFCLSGTNDVAIGSSLRCVRQAAKTFAFLWIFCYTEHMLAEGNLSIQKGLICMEELKYLRGKTLQPGSAPFITHVIYPVEEGYAKIWLYDVFPGVQLMVTDFGCETCFEKGISQDVLSINHCHRGRFECAFDSQHYIYLREGDVAINNMLHMPIGSSFPLRYYYGSTIIIFPKVCDQSHVLAYFGVSAQALIEQHQLHTRCPVFRRDAKVEALYDALYAGLCEPNLPCLRMKMLALLYHFQTTQSLVEAEETYIQKSVAEKIKHVREHLVKDLEHRVGLQELANAHELSLTQLKKGFKQIYGESPYTYLRNYKMHHAAKLLLETDEKIGNLALALGYQNPSKFSDAFHAVMGCTPDAVSQSK